jgi:hypothetical protein
VEAALRLATLACEPEGARDDLSACPAASWFHPRRDCNPSYTPQAFSEASLGVSLFDGSVRTVTAGSSPRTWGLLLQPNDGQPSWQAGRTPAAATVAA